MARKRRARIRKRRVSGKTANELEVRLLDKGYVPKETKLGTPFKGRNRVIIA